jgi:hypothetical protein
MAHNSPVNLQADHLVVGPHLEGLSRSRAPALACTAAALFGIALTVACFYPGYMSPDSVEQLAQARSGVFTDWHPPIMSFLWRFSDKLFPGPFGMLLLNNLLFWPGLALICYRCLGWAGAPVTIAFGLSPAVFGLLSTVWKDVAFGASMVLAVALLLNAQLARSKSALILSSLPILYALSVRHNAGPGVLPLILYGAWVYLNVFRGVLSWRATVALGVLAFALLFAVVTFVNRQLSVGRQMSIMQTVLLHDLTAISLAEGTILLPKWVRPDGSVPTVDELRKIYSAGLVSLFSGNPGINLQQTRDPTDLANLRKAWFAAVLKHPGAYARHRINVFKAMLGIEGSCYAYEIGISANPFGIQVRPSEANRFVMHLLSIFRNSWAFRAWCYLAAIGLMSLIFLRLHSATRTPALALACSALLYEAPYFFIVPTCDFRYSWFVVLTAFLMSVLLARALFFERWNGPPGAALETLRR